MLVARTPTLRLVAVLPFTPHTGYAVTGYSTHTILYSSVYAAVLTLPHTLHLYGYLTRLHHLVRGYHLHFRVRCCRWLRLVTAFPLHYLCPIPRCLLRFIYSSRTTVICAFTFVHCGSAVTLTFTCGSGWFCVTVWLCGYAVALRCTFATVAVWLRYTTTLLYRTHTVTHTFTRTRRTYHAAFPYYACLPA